MTMQENTPQNTIKTPHSLHIDRRRRACITGVTDVCSYHETEIVLRLDGGVMVINGQNLHIGRLLLDEGKLDIDGMIDGVTYESAAKRTGIFGGFFTGLFHKER